MMLMHHLFMSRTKILERTDGLGVDFWPFDEKQVISVSLSFKICVSIFVFITAYGTYRNIASRTEGGASELACYSITRYVKLLMSFHAIMIPSILFGTISRLRNPIPLYMDGGGRIRMLFNLLIDYLGLARALGTPTYNGTWWYLSVAAFLLFVLPPVICLVKKTEVFHSSSHPYCCQAS